MRFDMNEVVGMTSAKRALEIAAAGGHNILMTGPAGSGRTMLARRLTTILPEISPDEDAGVEKIYKSAKQPRRMNDAGQPIGCQGLSGRPFRSPHHTISEAGLVGVARGGDLRYGEVDLARYGVLMLDELPMFRQGVQEALTGVLDSRVQLVGAMGFCPCGSLGANTGRECRCSADEAINHIHGVAELLLSCFDMRIEVEQANYATDHTNRGDSSETIRERVTKAREIQITRQGALNAHTDTSYAVYSTQWYTARHLQFVTQQKGLDRHAYVRVARVARTIADLAGAKDLAQGHFNEALRYV